jgi:hypothetical protein
MTSRTLGAAAACALALALMPATASGADVPFMRGITVGEWGPSAYPPKKTRALMRSLARRHVDTVTLFVVWTQAAKESTVVTPGEKTAPIANLRAAIRSARAAGLRVVLRPYLEPVPANVWRGAIQPASVPQWFASYRRFILRYADLARREKVRGLTVGTEMVSLSDETEHWRALIAAVRRRFKGFVTYQANWDETDRVRFWSALDAVSISAYYPVARAPGASVSQIMSGWLDWQDKVEALHAASGRPVMFGEIGYRTVETTAVTPWDIEPARFSVAAQLAAYEAALRFWYAVPWFAGFHWWYVAPQREIVAGRRGADHRPTTGALQLLARWYRRPRGAPR